MNILSQLVNDQYTENQLLKVKETIKRHTDNDLDNPHLLNYEILSVALDDLANLSKKEVKEYYSIDDLQSSEFKLNKVDFVIANIVTTLQQFNCNVKEEYESALVLDRTQPEFKYLVNQVLKYLSQKHSL